MLNPFRMSAHEQDDLEPPPMSYFIINKYALGVAVVFFILGFYCAHHYYNPQPPDRELPEMNDLAIDKLLDKPCQDTVIKSQGSAPRTRCTDPRARATIQGTSWDNSFIVCSCSDSVH